MNKQVRIVTENAPSVNQIPQKPTQNNFLPPKLEEEEPEANIKDRKVIKLRNVIDEHDEDDDFGRDTKKDKEMDNLDHLDLWDDQLNSKKRVFMFDKFEKSAPSQATQKSKQFEIYGTQQGPQINQQIINQIFKAENTIKKVEQKEQTEPEVNVKFQMFLRKGADPLNPSQLKTLEQVRIEMNKKLLNTLLLDKVQRKIDQSQKNGQTWTLAQVEEGTTQIFSEQARILKLTTLNNFKGLTEYFKSPAQFIDYDRVLMKAKHYSNKPPSNFTSENNVSEFSMSATNQSTKAINESYLMYQQQTKEHKLLLLGLRIDNNNLVGQLQQIEQNILELKRKYYLKLEKVRTGQVEQQEVETPAKPRRTRFNVMDALEKVRGQRTQEEGLLQLHIQSVKNNIQQNNERQSIIQKELDELREKKRRCKMLLKEAYIKILKDSEHHPVPEGIISIVKNLKKIQDQVKPSAFPNYLDQDSIQYVYKIVSLEQQIEEIRSQIAQSGVQQNQQNNKNQNKFAINNTSDLKNKDRLNVRKLTTTGNDHSDEQTGKQEGLVKLQSEQSEVSFKASRLYGDQPFQNKDQNLKLIQLQLEVDSLSKLEQQRLFKLYMSKRSKSDIQELRKTYCALFGQNEGDILWYQFQNVQGEINGIKVQRKQNDLNQGISINELNSHSTLPSIPPKQYSKMRNTMKSLTEESHVDYNYDLLESKIISNTNKTRRVKFVVG